MNTDYSVIEIKIIQFIKKHYLSKLIKGILFSSLIFIVLSILLLIVEYFSFLSPIQKSILLLIYLIIQILAFIFYIVLPFLGFIGINIKISKQLINQTIVSYFPEIKDKLWNLFEFKNYNNNELYSEELVLASIDQRINSIKHFNFSDAVQLKKHLKLLYIFLFFIVLSSLFISFFPSIITNSGNRLVNFSKSYIKPSPFNYSILNEDLSVGKGNSFILKVKVEASKSYENISLKFGGNNYLMKEDSLNHYSYQFNNINNSISLSFVTDNYESEKYTLTVLPKPLLSSFKVQINKPKYTNLKNDQFENITEFIVPLGSICSFSFDAFETDTIIIRDEQLKTYYITDNFQWKRNITNDSQLSISLKNKHFEMNDLLKIEITTINDDYPSITLKQIVDSIDFTSVYFKGQLDDDYGFNKLNFMVKIDNQIDTVYQVQIIPNLLQQDFLYAFDFNEFKNTSDYIEYYFEIFDNDAINGSKSSISEIFSFTFPNANDIFEYQDKQFENIEDILANSMNVTRELKKDLMNLQEKIINSDLTDWERKEIIKNIFSKRKSLEETIQKIQEKNEEMNNYMDSFTDENKELAEKQQQIQNILEEVMSDELKKLMDEFNKMMNDFNQSKMNELTEKIDISLDDLSKQLDRNLELLKKMKIEKQLELITSDIQKHIKKQENLINEIEKGQQPQNLLEQQSKEKESIIELEKQYNDIEKLNQELEEPLNLYDFNKEFDEIEKEFNNSVEQQKKNNKKKSQESMQNNKSKMENLAFMMTQMKDAAFAEQNSESLANLFQILDNTIIFSFEQEKLINSTNNNEFNSQLFIDQKKIYKDFQVIKDSLYALSKREPSVDMAVNKEIVNIENNFKNIDRDLTENRVPQARLSQQNVLTSANNLALFLSEVIKNIQQQMANSMPGNQNCQKPGNNPNPNSMGNSLKSMQQSMQQQLEKMMQMMKDGQNGQQMNGEFGKALSQQEKMQNMLQQMMNQGNVGSDAYETLKQADQLLNKIREDILRNNISGQTINRQKEILTRLLEAENAENERELDDKRKSNTAEEQRISETAKYFDNTKSSDNFKEKIVKQKLVLMKYYQKRYQDYVNQLDSINGSKY